MYCEQEESNRNIKIPTFELCNHHWYAVYLSGVFLRIGSLDFLDIAHEVRNPYLLKTDLAALGAKGVGQNGPKIDFFEFCENWTMKCCVKYGEDDELVFSRFF